MRVAAVAVLALALGALTLAGCASAGLPPPADVAQRAAAARSYSGRLRVSLQRARAARPDRGAPRLPAARRRCASRSPAPRARAWWRWRATRRLTAVFPGERAVFRGEATAAGLEDLLGVALRPAEVMDLLRGRAVAARPRLPGALGPVAPARARRRRCPTAAG